MNLFTKNAIPIFAALLLLMGSSVQAQRRITGVVKDAESGETLIGATVVEKERRTNGSVTDIDGNFTLTVSPEATAIVVSYTGYEPVEQSIVGKDVIEVAMGAGSQLKEVLVIGYGTVKREDATGLVQSVSAASFNKGAITGPQELLAGKVAGVVITTDGSPGGGSKIRIRGESSLSASKDPLIVIDGIPLDNGGVNGSRNQLNIINPNDIETFTVLKDASAAAIYGNRASGGVIIITTKKGKLGKKIQVGYSANVSWSERRGEIDVLSADEFRAAIAAQPDSIRNNALPLLGNASTDWQNEIYQKAFGQDHNLNVSGGVGGIPYRVSLGYTNKDGLLKTDNFSRYTAGLNLNPGFFKNTLQFNLGFKGMLSDNHFAEKGAIGAALSFDPTKPVKDTSTTKYEGYTTWKIGNGNPNGLAPSNPVSLLNLRNDNSTVTQYITSGSVDYRLPFVDGLRLNLNLALDYAKGEGTVDVPNTAAFAFNSLSGGGVNNMYEQTKKNSLLESYANYKRTFGRHDVDAMVGYSWQHFEVSNFFRNSDKAGTDKETTTGQDPAELFLISTFARMNYGFDNKYLLTVSLRRDGTSRFNPDYRWGLFPAAALAVKIIENDQTYFNNLKLRTSWGLTGQQDIGGDYYSYLARYQFGFPNARYQLGNDTITTIRPNGYVADIKWEETNSYNVGIDFSIVKDRIGGSVDWYRRNTTDLLNEIPFAALSNLTNIGVDNIGNMFSTGVELSLNTTPVSKKNIVWDLSANFAWNRSEITKLINGTDPGYTGVPTGGIAGGVGSNIQNHQVGYAPNSFFVFEQKYDENGKLLEGQFINRDKDTLNEITQLDRYRYRNPAPRYTIGITSNLSVYNFDFSFGARANLGNYVYNNIQTDMGYLNRLYHPSKYLSNVNQSAVTLGVFDQAKLTFSDHFVTNASFFRIDHVTVGYTFRKVIGNALRVFGTVQNPLVVTQYKGLDPEIDNGIDNNVYPRARTFLFGLSVSF